MIVNIAGYRFVPIQNLEELKIALSSLCNQLYLKGTILLSHEGINAFVAGTRNSIDRFVEQLVELDNEFAEIEFKESLSDHQPFSRMLVRIKKEIIAFGKNEISPGDYTSSKISADELRDWLDQKRDVVLLDVRNDYEIEVGTFKDALPIKVDNFRDFPEAVEKLPAEIKQKPIVMFCTGGIRCEKAGPFMENAGFENIFQLDGGILKYFEDVGAKHYDGDCFVFDKRVAVDANLEETDATLCYACQTVLTKVQTESPHYDPPNSCPICYVEPQSKMKLAISRRLERLREVTSPLPGSVPYENIRPLRVAAKHNGFSLVEFLADIFPQLDASYWDSSIDSGRIRIDDRVLCREDLVETGQKLQHHFPQTVEPDVNPDIDILFEDDHLVIVDKPAPLPVHPSGRFNKNTLKYLLDLIYHPQVLRPAHRLDAATTGLIMFTRSRVAARKLQPMFARGLIEKTYLAKVNGNVEQDSFDITLPISTEKNDRGTRRVNSDGKPALTHCRTTGRDANSSVLEIEINTGRTHQIRIHLNEIGHGIMGDQLYQQDDIATDEHQSLCLHSWKLRFSHPISGESMLIQTERPDWARI